MLLDVRPMLAEGRDPLGEILRRTNDVPPNGELIVEAPFNPAPLRRVLAMQGFSSRGERIASEHWRIRFIRDGRGLGGDEDEAEDGEACPGRAPGDPDDGVQWREGSVWHIDVRGLVAPLPMLAILRLLATVGEGERVVVHHEREPVYLYPELAERGWAWALLDGAPGEVRLELWRDAA